MGNEAGIIKPTIGRKVWYWPVLPLGGGLVVYSSDQPLDATVVFVFDERTVNLQVVDHSGRATNVHQVPLLQPGDARPENGFFAEWMPYQKGQAAKSEPPAAPITETRAGYTFRKKPVVIEAFQMTRWRRADNKDWPNWLNEAWNKPYLTPGSVCCEDFPHSNGTGRLVVHTLEGILTVEWNDWIIRGVNGELYPCKPDIFAKTYDAVPIPGEPAHDFPLTKD